MGGNEMGRLSMFLEAWADYKTEMSLLFTPELALCGLIAW